MARFYASIEGQAQTPATRRGGKESGIAGHIRGWNVGVRVSGRVGEDGQDEFDVYLTGGSSGAFSSKFLGRFVAADLTKT